MTALPAAVAERLAHYQTILPPEAYAELARRLRTELTKHRREQVAARYDQDSPEALAAVLGYTNPPHIRLLHRFSARAKAGEQVRAIITLPPRHAKTETLLKVGALWRLSQDPDCRIMQIGGDKDLVSGTSRWVRDQLEDPGTTYPFRPRRDVRAVDNWGIEGRSGGIFVGSTGSRIIGRGANLLQVDDLLDRIQADSEKAREKAWAVMQASLGRLEPGASVMVVMSRWHADDPVGRLLREQPGRWELVTAPAVAEAHGFQPLDPGKCLCGDPWAGGHEDPFGREPGEALWPERYDETALAEKRIEVGAFVWAAQWQQRPMKREGGLWKEPWITDRRAGLDDGTGQHPAILNTVQEIIDKLAVRAVSVDPSASDNENGDEAGIVCGGRDTSTRDLWVTHDLSGHYTPEGWTRTSLVAAIELDATLVYEQNLTPAFVRRVYKRAWESLIEEAIQSETEGHEPRTVARVLDPGRVRLPELMPDLKPVRALVGKALRAEPVAQIYEQRRVVHNGVLTKLEDQQLTWKPTDKASPDRLDSAVHMLQWLGDAVPAIATVSDEPAILALPSGAAAGGNPRYN